MRSRVSVQVVAAALLALTALPAAAAPAGQTRLRLDFDQVRTLTPGTSVTGSPARASAQVVTDGVGQLRRRPGARGRGVEFPCAGCGRAVLEVGDRSSLDPRSDTFAFGASVRIGPGQATHSMNVMQKGYHDEPGGQYKLQVDQGVPSCVVSGSSGRVLLGSTASIADRAWHRLTCRRTPSGVVLVVDGSVVASSATPTGNLSSAAPVRLGGKDVTSIDNDQLHGRLDDVFVRIDRTG
ncbi:LamG-like jellyroll fold domain-containing protein [Nocardioides sp. 616]|uniref:LamG-like jellyroll fold domain-containing protein n=1 Tax=Nocardioides sp. 616 TaxID=2268090 RepID=UPI0013B39AF3|nr:LamG-like jellyroll fold domain-containing protein [Nocardioides sp. 616]